MESQFFSAKNRQSHATYVTRDYYERVDRSPLKCFPAACMFNLDSDNIILTGLFRTKARW